MHNEPFYDRKVKHWSVISPYVDRREKHIDLAVCHPYNTALIKTAVGATGTNRLSKLPLWFHLLATVYCLVHLLGFWIKPCLLWGRHSCDGPLLLIFGVSICIYISVAERVLCSICEEYLYQPGIRTSFIVWDCDYQHTTLPAHSYYPFGLWVKR